MAEIEATFTPYALAVHPREKAPGIYERYIKRPQDVVLSAAALVVLSPVIGVTAALVASKLGQPVIFKQQRPGKEERIFTLYKFRTMTDERDEKGNLLPDDQRMTDFGRKLRETSLDELPELWNILKGDMAIVGPRPQLVRDMVFMTPEQRHRHCVRPGVTGLAQINGRNTIGWDDRLRYDLEYVNGITFLGDWRIIFQTIGKVLVHADVATDGMETSEDFGDYLLRVGRVSDQDYVVLQQTAYTLCAHTDPSLLPASEYSGDDLVSIITPTYNAADYIAETIESVLAQTYKRWEMIIVDDCSSDNTEEVVSRYSKVDRRIKYHRLAQNSGAAVARTEAMKIANGRYMAFLDSDDLWYPEKLGWQLEYMKTHEYAFTCTSYEQVDEKGRPRNKVIKAIPKTDYNRLLLDCPVGNSSVMYDVQKMGKFEVPNIRKRNDDALWLRMLKKEQYIYGMPEVLMRYRVREGSISHNKLSVVKYHWILYRDIEHLSVARSIFHIGYWGLIKVIGIK